MADENASEMASSDMVKPSGNGMSPVMIGAVVVIVVVVIGALFFFTGQKDKQSFSSNKQSFSSNKADDAPTETIDRAGTVDKTESTGEAIEESDGALAVTLEAGSFYFKPNIIRAKLGQTVRLKLNSVSVQHDFVIDKLGVKSPLLPSGQSATIEFVADTLGEFEFYCSVGNHKQMGMVGTLVVEQ